MTKTQRELLILVGILVVIAVILYVRLGGGGGEGGAPATPPVTAAAPPAGGQIASGTPGTAGPDQPENTDPGMLLITQAPIEMLNPALSDSAVAARIGAQSIRDPFASDRRTTRAPTRQPSRPQVQQPRREPERQERFLEDWPADVEYGGLLPRVDAPGEYSVRFNGRPVRVGETIPGTLWNNQAGTEWELVEASRILIVIRREVKNSEIWEVTTYRHIRRLSTEGAR